jgi:hypothetical protein
MMADSEENTLRLFKRRFLFLSTDNCHYRAAQPMLACFEVGIVTLLCDVRLALFSPAQASFF